MRSSISVVIPHVSLSNTDESLYRCIKSFPNYGIQWVIEYNDGGYAAAVNKGMKKSIHEWIFVVNNDTEIISGNILNMCDRTDCITIPKIIPEPRDNRPRSFFVVPRKLYLKLRDYRATGFLDELFYPGYFEDDDLHRRMELLGIPCEVDNRVLVCHHDGGGLTIKQFGEQECFNINKERYEKKWGIEV